MLPHSSGMNFSARFGQCTLSSLRFSRVPSSKSVNALAEALAEARCLTSGAEFSPDQESQYMQKFANIDEMCKCSEAGKVMFEKAFQSFKYEI